MEPVLDQTGVRESVAAATVALVSRRISEVVAVDILPREVLREIFIRNFTRLSELLHVLLGLFQSSRELLTLAESFQRVIGGTAARLREDSRLRFVAMGLAVGVSLRKLACVRFPANVESVNCLNQQVGLVTRLEAAVFADSALRLGRQHVLLVEEDIGLVLRLV